MSKSRGKKEQVKKAPRDEIRTAFSGDENHGPARHQKTSTTNDRTKARRLWASSAKTPVR